MEYLEFEKPIEDLIEKLNQAKELGEEGDVNVSKIVSELERKIKNARKEIYGNLTPWQKVQMSRRKSVICYRAIQRLKISISS